MALALVLTGCANVSVKVGQTIPAGIEPARTWSVDEFAAKVRTAGTSFEVLPVTAVDLAAMLNISRDGDQVWEMVSANGRNEHYCLVRGREILWQIDFEVPRAARARS